MMRSVLGHCAAQTREELTNDACAFLLAALAGDRDRAPTASAFVHAHIDRRYEFEALTRAT